MLGLSSSSPAWYGKGSPQQIQIREIIRRTLSAKFFGSSTNNYPKVIHSPVALCAPGRIRMGERQPLEDPRPVSSPVRRQVRLGPGNRLLNRLRKPNASGVLFNAKQVARPSQIPLNNNQNQVRNTFGMPSDSRQGQSGCAWPAMLMNMDGDNQDFSEELDSCSRPGFRKRFGQIVGRMGLDSGLERRELSRLYEAAFLAALCNISFNGMGGCAGEIRPEKEPTRRRLEQAFMSARDNFFGSPGWKALPRAQRKAIEVVFLTVFVAESNLA
jgi:hypothetical protein